MEEEYPSFDLNFEFLEPDVEGENQTNQYETNKEVEEFINIFKDFLSLDPFCNTYK